MNIRVFTSDIVTREAAKALNALFAEQKGKTLLFLSSGGSSLKLLDYIDPKNFGPNSTIGALDERYSEDSLLNNCTLIERSSFWAQAKKNGAHLIDTKVSQNESMESLALRYEKELRDWVTTNKSNTGSTDAGTIIATVGIGPDGHTSGIMPYPENPEFFQKTFCNENRWIASYDAENKNPHRLRITTTVPFFKKIDAAIIFMTGQDKKPALEKLLVEKSEDKKGAMCRKGTKVGGVGGINESPCRIWREIPGTEIITDINLK